MTSPTPRARAPVTRGLMLATILAAGLLAGCGGEPPAPVPAVTLTDSQDATTRIGDVTARATVIPTMALGSLVAEKYSIRRADNQVMLLVGLRHGDEGAETSVPATIVATVSDLRGDRSTIKLRDLTSDDLVDYVGTVQISRPDTLKFELDITLEDGKRATMRFTRDFKPD